MTMALTGVDSACSGGVSGQANSCGAHIHKGTSCELHSLVGGHYYGGQSDPWAAGFYGDGSETKTLDWGLDGSAALGRVFIVHDYAGGRVACAVIKPDTLTSTSYAIDWLESY